MAPEWDQVIGLPGVPVGLGDHARDLAPGVVDLAERPDQVGPRLQFAVADRRFGEVVDDESCVAHLAGQRQRRRQLARSHQQVVDKSGRADRPDAARNVVP